MKIKRIIEKYKWEAKNAFLKKEHKIRPVLNNIKNIFVCFLVLFAFFYLLNKSGIIIFNKDEFIKYSTIEWDETYKDLIITQISSTFLTTAIISLISSIEDKRILGEKEVDLLFGKKLLGFHIPMFILYITMIINIFLLITFKDASIILSLFYLSIFVLIHIISKIGTIFLTSRKYINDLYSKYYKECEKNIIYNIPPRDYNSNLLTNLNQQTIILISNNDVNYVKNVNMYKGLIDRLLFNIPKKLQEYHLKMSYAPSIINDYIEIIEHFIYFKDFTRAIQYYNWLLSRFNFHNIYIPYEKMNVIFEEIANKILDLKNEYEAKDYLSRISSIITQIEVQQHFALTNDYSNIKIHKSKIKYKYHYNSEYFAILYDKIFNNKYLKKFEKFNCYTELFEIFRMSAHNGCNVISDITNFSFEFENPTERKMPPCILGQATAFLLLKNLQYKDARNFKLFAGMNIEEKELRIAIHLMLLTIIKIEDTKEYKNIYSEFYGINLKICKKIIEENATFLFNSNECWGAKYLINYLQEDYEYIKLHFNEKVEDDFHFYSYNFKYNNELIEEYFLSVSNKYNKNIKIFKERKKDYKKIIDAYI